MPTPVVQLINPLSKLLDMPSVCKDGDEQSWSCAAVYEWTGNEALATATTWIIGKPLAIATILLVAVLVRWLSAKAIDRVVRRAQSAPLPGARQAFNRRAQRAQSLGSLLKSITTTVVFGIAVVMITGDHQATATSIAHELGLDASDGRVLTGPELERIDDEDLRRRVDRVAVYARVSPEHKLRIVRAHQAQGSVVSMTGDGDYICRVLVADVPAYEKLLKETLLALPGVATVNSSVALKQVKLTTKIAIPAA